MRIFLIGLFLSVFQQENVPLLSTEEFSYEVEYSLKQKQKNFRTAYESNQSARQSVDMLAFVGINFLFPSFKETDKRIRVFQGNELLESRKIKKGAMKINLEMGYSEDLKEGVLPPVFRIYILNKDKQRRGQIKVEVRPNGELLINDVVSGMI